MTHYYVFDIDYKKKEVIKKNFKDFDKGKAIEYYNSLKSDTKQLYYVDCNGKEFKV